MTKPRNILYIMFDQLRWDYLSCYGHPHLQTPNIDRLAEKGVRFTNARVQSPICGPCRMSAHTGRYMHRHGSTWNGIPLRVGELTLGDHLRDQGMDCWLVGKTHMAADVAGMKRYGIDPASTVGRRIAECGFDVYERDDGMRPVGPKVQPYVRGGKAYDDYLKAKGYYSDNPWHDYANSAVDGDGNVLSGFFMKNAGLPANIAEEDSETPYLTRRGIEFIERQDGQPWCLHLSYIKPHWPYMVPAPYNDMFKDTPVPPPVRSDAERDSDHPVLQAFMDNDFARGFRNGQVRDAVVRTYMGLVKQIDDQMGELFAWLEATGRMQDTLIVLTSDHGDFLGDHHMGEKMFFYDQSVKVPFIVYDPSPGADATRGTTCDALIELIDVVPTFYQVAGGDPADIAHIVEGHSLLPIVHGQATETPRQYSFSEYDWSRHAEAEALGVDPHDAMITMVTDKRWKLVHFEGGFRPCLYDLETDPEEVSDLGDSPDHVEVRARLMEALNAWARRSAQRTTIAPAEILAQRRSKEGLGPIIGAVDERSFGPERSAKYLGRKAMDMRQKG
jgi:arylsulfatase A-like enzyme